MFKITQRFLAASDDIGIYTSIYFTTVANSRYFKCTPNVLYCDLSCIVLCRYGVYTLDSYIGNDKSVQSVKLTNISLRYTGNLDDIKVSLDSEDNSYFKLTLNRGWNSILIFGKSLKEYTIEEYTPSTT